MKFLKCSILALLILAADARGDEPPFYVENPDDNWLVWVIVVALLVLSALLISALWDVVARKFFGKGRQGPKR